MKRFSLSLLLFVIILNGGLIAQDNPVSPSVIKTGVYFGLTPALIAEFSGTQTVVCHGGQVTFMDQTTGSPTSWNWSFPGGNPATSTSQNPVVTYSTLGTYSVTLVVTNASGHDTVLKTDYINVTQPVIIYCASQGSVYSYECIGQVAFNSFINNSGASGYTNFTNLTIPMAAGGTVAVTLTPQHSGGNFMEYFRVWIDYNKDGDFTDADELAFSPSGTNIPINGNFTVLTGVSGTTRMRVSMKYNAVPTPCELFSYGEVEDYTVSFGEAQPPVANFIANTTTVIEGRAVQFTDR